jgi:hypothetical protein
MQVKSSEWDLISPSCELEENVTWKW